MEKLMVVPAVPAFCPAVWVYFKYPYCRGSFKGERG